jgi:hypothetical protein
MYHLFKIEIKYNSYSKILNNLTYMYAMNMILHSFEEENETYPVIKNCIS